VREYEEMKRQMEEDSDREILTLKTTYERKLQEEKLALTVSSYCVHVARLLFEQNVLKILVNNITMISHCE